jgi:sulfite exporter TauE/SafE
VSADLTLPLAFATGLFGAFHCLGMCSGIAGGFFVRPGSQPRFPPVLLFHAARILVYTTIGVSGAALGRILAQTGIIGKGQGVLMMAAGLLIVALGLGVLGIGPCGRKTAHRQQTPSIVRVRIPRAMVRVSHRQALFAGLLNGLVPCSLVFSVTIKAVATSDPLRAGLLMLAFGLGTLPTMATVSLAGTFIGAGARGVLVQLAGLAVIALGLWTLYEGAVFFDIMRGLSNW